PSLMSFFSFYEFFGRAKSCLVERSSGTSCLPPWETTGSAPNYVCPSRAMLHKLSTTPPMARKGQIQPLPKTSQATSCRWGTIPRQKGVTQPRAAAFRERQSGWKRPLTGSLGAADQEYVDRAETIPRFGIA